MTSCRPFRRTSLPSLGDTTPALAFRPHAAERCRGRVSWSWSPGISGRDCGQWRRQDLLRSWGTPIVLLPCSSTPVGPTHQALAMRRRGPRCVHDEGSRIRTFEAQSHGFGTGCLRFAGRVAPTPRKTRFRLLAKLSRTGLITRRVPSKGFKVYPTSILLSQVQRSARTQYQLLRWFPNSRLGTTPPDPPFPILPGRLSALLSQLSTFSPPGTRTPIAFQSAI